MAIEKKNRSLIRAGLAEGVGCYGRGFHNGFVWELMGFNGGSIGGLMGLNGI